MHETAQTIRLTDDAESYARDGYLIVPDLISPTELAELEADLVKLARGGYPATGIEPVPRDQSDAEALERILCIHMPHFVSPLVRRFTTHPAIADVLGRIVGAHLQPGHWNGGVKCMQSMFFAKPPGKPGQAWHQDESFIPTRDRSLCAAWIAIDDATLDNGCLWVIPRSHLTRKLRVRGARRDTGRVARRFGAVLQRLSAAPQPTESKQPLSACAGEPLHETQSPLHWCLDEKLADGSSHGTDNRSVHVVCGEDPHAHLGYTIPASPVYLRRY
ncbi:MAG: phytanoyl-CoA dioxygenase family protein [Gammaproteobacteria bacterium]|nr:phytanoyl-CoA dioxygenase family protein [Gammaproteobacteria bacterium]